MQGNKQRLLAMRWCGWLLSNETKKLKNFTISAYFLFHYFHFSRLLSGIKDTLRWRYYINFQLFSCWFWLKFCQGFAFSFKFRSLTLSHGQAASFDKLQPCQTLKSQFLAILELTTFIEFVKFDSVVKIQLGKTNQTWSWNGQKR